MIKESSSVKNEIMKIRGIIVDGYLGELQSYAKEKLIKERIIPSF